MHIFLLVTINKTAFVFHHHEKHHWILQFPLFLMSILAPFGSLFWFSTSLISVLLLPTAKVILTHKSYLSSYDTTEIQ